MKEHYLAIMEQLLSAYSDEHIVRYFQEVKENGLTEHGFPRLTVNIGILIAHGKRRDLLPLFLEMMEFCCKTIPTVKAANDFSVREIVGCLLEVERSGVVDKADTARWRGYLATINPTTCYNKFAKTLTDSVRNWALFTTVSEYFRLDAGIGGSMEFIELQLGQQMQWIDENGMYRDNGKCEHHQPIMYDLTPRALFSLLLDRGYRGQYATVIDEHLRRAALLTLDMQSPNGEMAFGGRSNQFLHNEPWLITVCEYEAKRYARTGNMELAARFKAASHRALEALERWMQKAPILHIKNRFPTETRYGCEGYAYFDKYMITAASNLYGAYLICDETIPYVPCADTAPCVAETSPYFHKLFAKAGGYGLEFDWDGDPQYDACGLGRIHRVGAPSALCLSLPCPATPNYRVNIKNPFAFSLCSAVCVDGEWSFGADGNATYTVCHRDTTQDTATVTLSCQFANGQTLTENYCVSANGVSITVQGEGSFGYALPVFAFDGEQHTAWTADAHTLTVRYDGWICRYTTDGTPVDLNRTAANRNGHYQAFVVTGQQELHVHVELFPQEAAE